MYNIHKIHRNNILHEKKKNERIIITEIVVNSE